MSESKFSTATSRGHVPGGAGPPPYGYGAPAPSSCTHVGWTEERTAHLRKLWSEGLSASQIANRLGGITRNSVIGKANRLGLEGRARPAVPRRVAHAAPSAPRAIKRPMPTGVMVLPPQTGGEKSVAARAANLEARANPPENVVLMSRAFAPLPGRQPVPFGAGGCKWPVGGEGADMMCCGADRAQATPTDPNPPYCKPHAAAAFQKPKAGAPKSGNESLRRYAA